MANNVHINPIGIEIPISRIQKYLFDSLTDLGWGSLEVYGKAYKNRILTGLVPQWYKDDGEYVTDLYIVDTNDNNGNIFFLVDDTQKAINAVEFQATVKIVFMINLDGIYANLSKRDDVKAHKTVSGLLKDKSQFTIKSLETGLETVLKGFDTTNIKLADIQPLHIFAFKGVIKYNINKC